MVYRAALEGATFSLAAALDTAGAPVPGFRVDGRGLAVYGLNLLLGVLAQGSGEV